MNIEEIEHFLDKKTSVEQRYVKINFKNRDAVFGMFVKEKDYSHLKSKNFWRIVTHTHFAEYNRTPDPELVRIFSGSAFSKLSLCKEGDY